TQRVAASDCPYHIEQSSQGNVLAAENIAMPNLSPVHSESQACGDIAHVHEVHHEIKVKLKTPGKKMLQHQVRRCEVSVVGSDWQSPPEGRLPQPAKPSVRRASSSACMAPASRRAWYRSAP